jgi:hypothetical protein
VIGLHRNAKARRRQFPHDRDQRARLRRPLDPRRVGQRRFRAHIDDRRALLVQHAPAPDAASVLSATLSRYHESAERFTTPMR